MPSPKLLALTLLAALPLAACRASGTQASARSPYLQRVEPGEVTVALRLPKACAVTVHYGAGGKLESKAESAAALAHAVGLTGLSPGTEYTYEVESCESRTPPKRFVTAPAVEARRVHFTAVGDFGMGNEVERNVARAMRARRPELFLGLGDIAYGRGSEQELQSNLFVPMAELLSEVPLFSVLGNHEYLTEQGQPYLDNLYLPTSPSGGERYYSFDWGPVHFIALDSSCVIGMASAERCSPQAQARWLEQDLASSRAPWKIAFLHHPPWSSGRHGSQQEVRSLFAPLFERYGVALVLAGHDHNYERSVPLLGEARAAPGTRGVTYVVVGTGGAALRPFTSQPPAWSAARDDRSFGYLEVEVEGETLTARMVTLTGAVLDSFTLSHAARP